MTNPVLFEVVRAWEEVSVQYWLFGGSGIELLVGRNVRSHDDIDFFVSANDAKAALCALEKLGFRACHGSLEAGDVFYKRADTLLDLVPIKDGPQPRTFGELSTIVWPTGLLTPQRVRCSEGTVTTLTPEMHLVMKGIIKEFYGFSEPRTKDLVDIEHLNTLIAATHR